MKERVTPGVVSVSPDLLEDIMTSSTNNIMTSSTLSVVSEESEPSDTVSQVTYLTLCRVPYQPDLLPELVFNKILFY